MNTIIAIKPMLYRTPAHILKSAHDNESHFNSQSKNKPISFFFAMILALDTHIVQLGLDLS